MKLTKCLLTFMKISIGNACAQKGLLLIKKNGGLCIEAECDIDKEDIIAHRSIPYELSNALSPLIVSHVIRTKESIVLKDAVKEGMFTADPYILINKPKSIACMPIFTQANLVGVLYIENNATTNAFTPKRLETLKLLTSQIALSLENTTLHHKMKRLKAKLEQEIFERNEVKRALAEQVSMASLETAISIVIDKSETMSEMVNSCSESLVRHLGVACVHIWTLNKYKNVLELQANAGVYTRIDGFHTRIPVGKFEIGLIAQEKKPYITNRVIGNSRIHDQKWAKREGIVSFVGYPLIVKNQLMGVMTMFAHKPVTVATRQAISSAANRIAVCIRHKHAEDEIIEREKELRLITDSSLDTIFIVTKTGKFFYMSPSWKELSGFEADEMIGKSFISVVPKKELPRYWKTLTDVFFKKKIRNFESQIKHKEGHLVPVEFTGQLVKWRGSLVAQGTVRNIHERKRLEEEQKRLITAMESAGEAIAITDTRGYIQYVNPAFEQISGYKRNEIIGQNMRIFKSGKQNRSFYLDMWKKITKGNVWTGRIVNKKKDGTLFTELLTISPVRNSTGNIVNYVAVKRNVTREIELEAQLRQSQKFEALGTMARGIAHDFNNILSAIIGFTEITMGDLPEESEACDNLEEVLNASYRAKGLVRQIVAFSQQSGEERRIIDIVPVVKETLTMMRATLPNTIEIRYNICDEPCMIMGDSDQICQIVLNLCMNGGHAIGAQCGILTVNLGLNDIDAMTASNMGAQGGSYVKLEVTDSGCGMKPEVIERIFDPFFTTKPVGKGSGMGLAVVHGTVTSHNGVITVNSEPGKGSTFNVFFPLVKSIPELDTTEESILVPTGDEHILFVDDEESITRYSQKGLQRLGYKLTISTNSQKALEIFYAEPDSFDIVITDQTMHNMSGDTLARKILHRRPGIPIILCTGFSHTVNVKIAKEIGISECVMKPIGIHNLATTIRRVLEKRGVSSSP